MEDSSTKQQDTDDAVAIKAEERRRRLADMMMGSTPPSSDNNINRTSTPGTAVFTKRQQAAGSMDAANIKERSSTATTSVPTPPTELSDMESKALGRREQVSRLLMHPESSNTTSATTATNAKQQLLPRETVTQQHQVGAHQQKGAALLPSTKDAGTATSNSRSPLTALDDTIAEKQRLSSSSETAATTTSPKDTRGLATLRGAEQMALQKRRLLPSDIPDPPPPQQQHSSKFVLDSSNNNNNNNNDPTEMTATMTAELVDHEQDRQKNRQKIMEEARADLISKAVVASSVKTTEETNSGRGGGCVLLLIVCLIVTITAVVGGVCGSGLCTNSSTVEEDPVERAAAITELVNTMTFLQDSSIQYPVSSVNAKTPEEEALEFLIDNDALKLSVASGDRTRLIQRYALTVLWHTIGPWAPEETTDDPQSAWFAQPNECQWLGVVCNNEGLVVQLHLGGRDMRGQLPADLALLIHMTSLEMDDNKLTGTIPTSLAELSNLEQLDLRLNRLTGPAIPSFLAQLSELKEYTVGVNKMNGTIPEFLSNMTQLNALAVDFNNLSGAIPDFLGDMTGLTRLNVGANQFTGTIPSSIFGSLTGLEDLSLGGSRNVGSPSLLPLSGLRKLTSLSYIGTDFGGVSLPDEVGEWWPNMTSISFAWTNFSGRIPSSVVKWKHLTSLSFSFNKLSGSLPPGIFEAWSNLSELSLHTNDLTGTLPDEVGMWSNLVYFNIQRNAFRGTLPTTIGLMTNLVGFVVTGNQLSGEIPSEAKGFGWYDDNNFTGTAPFCSAGASTVPARVDCESVLCECCSYCE